MSAFVSPSTGDDLPWDQHDPLFGAHTSAEDDPDQPDRDLPECVSSYSFLMPTLARLSCTFLLLVLAISTLYSTSPTTPQKRRSPRATSASQVRPSSFPPAPHYSRANLATDETTPALLHPDRHRDPSLKKAADARFQSLSYAFEVLSDPHKRAIYDELGEDGLKTSWEVATKGKTAQELRAEYERLNRQQLEANLENLVKSKGELTITSDARILFLSDDERIRLGGPEDLSPMQRLQSISTRQLFLKHSFTPINPATSIVLTSQLLARQGVGAGNMLIKLQHNLSSKLSLEIGTTLLRPRSLTFKSTYSPDADTFVRLDVLPLKSLSFPQPPKFTLTLGRKIFAQTTGTLTLRSGNYALGSWGKRLLQPYSDSTLSLGLHHDSGWNAELTSGVFTQQLSTSWGKTVLGGVKLNVFGVVTNTGAASVGWSADRRITENVKAGMGVEVAVNGSMTFKLRFTRLGQRIHLPILVASSFDAPLFATLTILPAAGMIATNYWILAPRKRRRVTSSKIRELRKEYADYILEKRTEALEAQALLKEHVARRIREEESKNVPLQSLLAPSASQLTIPPNRSKSHLLGFYDCAVGEKKQLRIRYRFRNKVHVHIYEDREAVGIPMREHCLE
ncbi:SPOSA6832_00882, partial [Sporobolomyces salmonicolor]